MNTVSWKKYSYVALIFALIAGTVFCDFGKMFDSQLKSKWYFFYTAVSVISVLSIFTKDVKIKKIGVFGYSLILLFLYCLVRVIFGQFLFAFLALSLLLLLLYHIFANIPYRNIYITVSGAIATTSFVLILYSLFQYVGMLSNRSDFRAIGNFDNPAGYASVLAISVPFVLYFTRHKLPNIRYVAWAIYAVSFAGILFSESRAGILAMLVVSFCYAARYCRRSWMFFLRKKSILAILVVLILSVLYFAKKDSANGRVLIWKCTWEMIKEKPLFGHGYKSFESKYMLYQADYFQQNPDSEFVLLSDNVKHPFNEYMLLIAEFGLIAFFLMLMFVIGVIVAYKRNQTEQTFIVMLSLLSVAVLACFSYPFKYPFTWLVAVFAVSRLLPSNNWNVQNRTASFYKFFVLLSSLAILGFVVKGICLDHKWYKAMNRMTLNKVETIPEYDRLYPYLKDDAYFLYNYAAIHNSFNNYAESLEYLTKCENLLNDYDVQMLQADNYYNLKRFDEAEKYYKSASNMCPNRFMVLYKMMKMYDENNQPEKALEMAKGITNKTIKIPSPTVSKIKVDAKKRIETDR